jgi:hypothetical protein
VGFTKAKAKINSAWRANMQVGLGETQPFDLPILGKLKEVRSTHSNN